MLKLLAHLGLYKDEFSLTHKDFDKERQWHLENIDAFGSNLLFVSFEYNNSVCCIDFPLKTIFRFIRCATEPHVLVMHQERVVHIPGCPSDADLCSLATIKQIFDRSLHQCNFDDFCENRKS